MKTITLKNYEIINILNSLYGEDSLINSKDPDKKLPVKILWKINGNIKTLKGIQERIQEEESKINEDYFNDEKSEMSAEGGQIIKEEYRAEFINKKNELMSIENEVNLSMINLNEIENLDFVPSDFMSIEFMIEDNEAEDI